MLRAQAQGDQAVVWSACSRPVHLTCCALQEKNVGSDVLDGKVGHIYMPKQDVDSIALAKPKGVKRERRQAAADAATAKKQRTAAAAAADDRSE